MNHIAHSLSLKFPSGIEISCRGSQEFVNRIYEEIKPLIRTYVSREALPHAPEDTRRPPEQPGAKKPYKSPVMYEHLKRPIAGSEKEDKSGGR